MATGSGQILCLAVAVSLCLDCLSQDAHVVVHGKVGMAVELRCPSVGSAPLLVEWLRQGEGLPILMQFGGHSPRVHPEYVGRVSLGSAFSLRLENLRLEDGGWFECRILHLDKPVEEKGNGSWSLLSVSAPPAFIQTPPPSLEVLQGDSLILSCSVHGNPAPAVWWRKDATDFAFSNTLSFASVRPESAGVYSCHASNAEGSVTHVTQLRVKGPPVIQIPPVDTVGNMSQDALLLCRAEADPPNMTYVWWRDGSNVYHIDSLKSRVKILVDGTLLIHRLLPEDAGNYTCMPTNGLLTPPTASAYLTVKHPAQSWHLPSETYLPTGMSGRITCPVRANPPLLYVDWRKDGQPLQLDKFPGWTVESDGSLLIAAVNENALGTYTCTPYNSYGTMGASVVTSAVLLDPPAFIHTPRGEYQQDVGTELVIPCQAAGLPSVNVTWRKLGVPPRAPYVVTINGSLLLRPLSKDQHGTWECRASNLAATVSRSTRVSVLGTTPHAVSSLAAMPGTNVVSLSWHPGFDGGWVQSFVVWMKNNSQDKQEWVSVTLPSSDSSLLIEGLLPNTSYQFSVVPQNRVGPGPFSDFLSVRTLALADLAPPTSLWANRSTLGVVLHWTPPIAQSPGISGFILQARREDGDWFVLDGAVGSNVSEMLVEGLQQDCIYELRLLSRGAEQAGAPSAAVTISTAGVDAPPARRHFLLLVPQALWTGMALGVSTVCVLAFLCSAVFCVVRRRKKLRVRRKDGLHLALTQNPSVEGASPHDSPNSIQKLKLLSTCSQSSCSSFDKASCSEYEDHLQHHHLLCKPLLQYNFPQSTCRESTVEFISRGPDGRFVLYPSDKFSDPQPKVHRDLENVSPKGYEAIGSILSNRSNLKSSSSYPEKDQSKRSSAVYTVHLPNCRFSQELLEHKSDHVQVQDYVKDLQDLIPSLENLEQHPHNLLLERGVSATSTLVLQMEYERERGNLSRCLQLAQEREEMERQLKQYGTSLRARLWQETANPLQEEDGSQPTEQDNTSAIMATRNIRSNSLVPALKRWSSPSHQQISVQHSQCSSPCHLTPASSATLPLLNQRSRLHHRIGSFKRVSPSGSCDLPCVFLPDQPTPECRSKGTCRSELLTNSSSYSHIEFCSNPFPQSSVLDYLSLPGFVEMSVDDPTNEEVSSVSSGPAVELTANNWDDMTRNCKPQPHIDLMDSSSCRPGSFSNSRTSAAKQKSLEKHESGKSVCAEFLDPDVWADSLRLHSYPETPRPSANPEQHREASLGSVNVQTLQKDMFKQVSQETSVSSCHQGESQISKPVLHSVSSTEHLVAHTEGDEDLREVMTLEVEVRPSHQAKEERDSFASQSSGRGSLGSCPSEKAVGHLDERSRRSLTDRRGPSVDERYELGASESNARRCPGMAREKPQRGEDHSPAAVVF